jgi:hypothetical protein
LILADDFLASPKDSLDDRQRLRVEEFQAGWRVPAVCTTESLAAAAAARVGLARFPFYGDMIGGHALQVGLREGFLRYQLLVFGRRG